MQVISLFLFDKNYKLHLFNAKILSKYSSRCFPFNCYNLRSEWRCIGAFVNLQSNWHSTNFHGFSRDSFIIRLWILSEPYTSRIWASCRTVYSHIVCGLAVDNIHYFSSSTYFTHHSGWSINHYRRFNNNILEVVKCSIYFRDILVRY